MKNVLKGLMAVIAKPLLSEIHKYKDIHKGESCYLMGDGVSVKWFDLGAFSDKISIPCGYIPLHNDFNKLSVKYFSLAEPWWFYPWNRDPATTGKFVPNKLQLTYRSIIDKYQESMFFINLSNYPVLNNKNIIYLFRDIYDKTLPANFITRRINAFEGSLRTSILLAIYLGFDHIYLVGYDYTHVPSLSLHWYEKGKGVLHPQLNYQKEFFEIAKEFIDLTTITLNGTSEFISAVTYKEYTGREPVYRENTELIDDQYLKVLDTWSGYSIY